MFFKFTYQTSPLLFFLVQGLVFVGLLWRKASMRDQPASRWLAGFIVLCGLYIVPWMCGYSGWYARDGYRDFLFFVPFQQLYLLGPVLYFYVQHLLNADFRFRPKDYWHFLPGAFYLFYSLVIFVYDFFIADAYFFYADGRDKDMAEWYQISGFLSILVYTIFSIRYYRAYRKLIYQELSYADAINFRWVGRFLVAFLIILLARFIFFMLFPGFGSFGQKWWYYLFFSVIAYYIALAGFMNTVEGIVAFRVPAFDQDAEMISKHKVSLASKSLDPAKTGVARPDESGKAAQSRSPSTTVIEDLEDWKARILQLVVTEQYYQNPTLTLADLAGALSTTTKQVSQVINQGFGQNFNDFINRYRIQAVQDAFAEGRHEQQTILGVAFDCGFNSKTTFNRVFKKQTGQTPLGYLMGGREY